VLGFVGERAVDERAAQQPRGRLVIDSPARAMPPVLARGRTRDALTVLDCAAGSRGIARAENRLPVLPRRSCCAALIHSSLATEIHTGAGSTLDDNEQLEFLGDSVSVSPCRGPRPGVYPEYRKAKLSRLKAHLVSAAHLHVWRGVSIWVAIWNWPQRGDERGRAKKTLLVDALEAVIAPCGWTAAWKPSGFSCRHVLDAPSSAMRRRAPTPAGHREFQERASGTGAGAQVAATALHVMRDTARALQKRSRRGARGQGFPPDRPTAAPEIAAQRAAPSVRALRKSVPGFALRRTHREPAAQPDRASLNPRNSPTSQKSERILGVPGHADHLFSMLIPAWPEEHRPRPRAGCGTGYFAHCLRRERGWPVVPMDYSWHGFANARQMGLERAVQGDIMRLPFCRRRLRLVMPWTCWRTCRAARAGRRAWLGRGCGAGRSPGCPYRALDIPGRSRHPNSPSSGSGSPGAADGVDGRRGACGCCAAHTLFAAAAGGAGEFRVWEPLLRKTPASGVNRGALARQAAVCAAERSRRPGSVPVTVSGGPVLVLIGEKWCNLGGPQIPIAGASSSRPYNDAPHRSRAGPQTSHAGRYVADYEVIVVNEWSRDATGKAEQLAGFSPWLRVVTHAQKPRLRRRAAQAGSRRAKGIRFSPMATASMTWASFPGCSSCGARTGS